MIVLPRLFPQLKDQRLHFLTGQRIKRTKRLIHEDQIRIIHKAPGKRNTLLHATRQLIGWCLTKTLETHSVEPEIDQLSGLLLTHTLHAQSEIDIPRNCKPLEQGALLKHHAAFGAWRLNIQTTK